LGVTLSQQGGEGRYLGTPFGLDDILIVPDGTELQIVSAPTWRAAALAIPEEEFLDRMVTLIHADSPGGPGLATLSRPQGARLRRACEDFFRATERHERSGDRDFPLRSMAVDLADFAMGLIAEGRIESVPKPGYLRRLEIFRKAEEIVRSSNGDVPRIPELCRVIGTSERSLRYAFESTAGVSPSAYLKAQRLSRVHATLLQSDPGETLVKTVAYQHGFWHLGQFSQDYRQLFGEAPSITLARERGTSGLQRIA
jgi:AraC-like DNA-binding protein